MLTGSSACDFFKELQGAEAAGETDTDGAETEGEADTDACGLEDDYCAGQDTLESCDYASGIATTYNCAQLCGEYVNFSCLTIAAGSHGCWCVEPDPYGWYTCTDLEACLAGCGTDVAGECGNQCFLRTTATTIRLLGALVACSEVQCQASCVDAPEGCMDCLLAAKAGLYGDCSVERSLCDADESDDEPWP
jgi:hypothetical protein